jgi:hypothetical protein
MTIHWLALSLTLLSFLATALQQPSSQQEITVQLLDSRTGKPIATDDVEIWVDKDQRHMITTHSGPDGLAMVELPAEAVEISVNAQQDGWYLHRCDLSRDTKTPAPFYLLSTILQSGIIAPNRCNHKTEPLKPGELTLFLRPQNFWEKMQS